MDSCPVELEPFEKANRMEMTVQNSLMYIQGLYVRDAILSSIGNSQWFKAKGEAPYKYPKEPYKMFADEGISEGEKQRDLDLFIAQEQVRRANWRLAHPKNKEEEQ